MEKLVIKDLYRNTEQYINKEIKNVIVNSKFMKEIMKLKEFSEMRCSF